MQGLRVHGSGAFAIATALALLLGASFAYAQTAAVELVSCAPSVAVGNNNTFSTKRGDIVTFSCLVQNKGNTQETVLLAGARSKEGGTNPALDTSVAIALDMPQGGEKKIDVPFLALFENGTYRYELVLKNLADGAPMGHSISYSGVLDGAVAKIKSAAFDRASYTEGQPMTLALSTTLPSDVSTTPFFLDVVAKDKKGGVCAYGITNKPITVAEESDTFALPGGTVCETAAIGVIVKGSDGFPTDTRDIPITMRSSAAQPEAPASTLPGRWSSIIVLIAALVIIVGYGVWHARRSQPNA